MVQNDRFLGGVAPRANPRTFGEEIGFRAAVRQEDRILLGQNDRMKLQANAEKGLELKYDLLDSVSLTDIDTLKAVYQMAIRTEEMKQDMARYDIVGVCSFRIVLR